MDPIVRRCLPTDCDDCKSVNGSGVRCDYALRICGPVREQDLFLSWGSTCHYRLPSKCAVKPGKNYNPLGEYSSPILEDISVEESGPIKRDDPSLRSSVIRRENLDSQGMASQLILERMADPNEA